MNSSIRNDIGVNTRFYVEGVEDVGELDDVAKDECELKRFQLFQYLCQLTH